MQSTYNCTTKMATRAEPPSNWPTSSRMQANCYGEDIKRLMGLHTARLGFKTYLQGVENGQVQSSGTERTGLDTRWPAASQMSTRYRTGLRTSQCWFSSAAICTRHRAMQGRTADRDVARALSVRDVEGVDTPE